MPTIRKVAAIMQLAIEHGLGDEWLPGADHDIVYLPFGGEIEKDSELGQRLGDLGAYLSEEHDGWVMFV